MTTQFRKLNDGWNAEPNVPDPHVIVNGSTLTLEFRANPWEFPRFEEDQSLQLVFANTRRYRLGPANDEGWYLGQCRFSRIAPAWGDFYEVSGDLRLKQIPPSDWHEVSEATPFGLRHFLFYLRDETFECDALAWELHELPAPR